MRRFASLCLALALCFGAIPAHASEQGSDVGSPDASKAGSGQGSRTVEELLAVGDFVEGRVLAWVDETFAPVSTYSNDAGSWSVSSLYEFGPSGDDAAVAYAAASSFERAVLIESSALSTEDLLRSLAETPGVIMAEPDYVVALGEADALGASEDEAATAAADAAPAAAAPAAAPTNDPSPQYFLKNIGEEPSDTVSPGGTNTYAFWEQYGALGEVVVAVVDSGVDWTHPDLKDRMWDGGLAVRRDGSACGYNCADGEESGYEPADVNFHGTHVAGILAAEAKNGFGGAGVAPNARIMALRIANKANEMPASAQLAAYDYMKDACEAGVNLVAANCSWGGVGASSIVYRAMEDLYDSYGVLSICAAGNEAADLDLGAHLPSSYPAKGIIVVDAVDEEGKLAGFSNFGMALTDLAAPGADVVSTVPEARGTCDFRDASSVVLQDNLEAYPGLFEFEPLSTSNTMPSTVVRVEEGAEGSPGSLVWAAKNIEAGRELSLVSEPVNVRGEDFDLDAMRYLAFQAYYSSAKVTSGALAVTVSVSDTAGGWIDLPAGGATSSDGVLGIYSYGWIPAVLDLSQLDGEVRKRIDWGSLRIKVTRQTSSTEAGGDLAFHLDDFSLMTGFSPYAPSSGTSQATPAVSGAAALLAGAGLDKGPDGTRDADLLRARILGGVQRTDALAGRCTSEGQLDVVRAATNPYPVVDALVRDAADARTATVEGSWFGDVPGTVRLDGVELRIASWEANRVEVALPEGLATAQRVVEVEREDGEVGRHLLLVGATDEGIDEGLFFESLPAPDMDALGVDLLGLQDRPWQMVAAGGRLYATAYPFGAGTFSDVRVRMLVFDPAAGSWSVEPAFNEVASSNSMVLEAFGDTVYLLTDEGKLYRFDTATGALAPPIDCSEALDRIGVGRFTSVPGASVCDGSSLTLMGVEYDEGEEETDVLRIDLRTGDAVRLASLPGQRLMGSGELVEGAAVLVGGVGSEDPLRLADTVVAGDGGSWTSSPLPDAVARNQLGTVATGVLPAGTTVKGLAGDAGAPLRERLVVAGLNGTADGDPDTYVYDPAAGSWLGVSARLAPTKQALAGGAVLDGGFYVLGFDVSGGTVSFSRLALAPVPAGGGSGEGDGRPEEETDPGAARPLARTGDATASPAVSLAAAALAAGAAAIAARRRGSGRSPR